MALPLVVSALTDVAEGLREHYVAGTEDLEGKFILDGISVDGLRVANVDKLNRALQTERDARRTADQNLLKFKDLDPEAARTAITRVAELEGAEGVEAQVAAIKKQLEEQNASQVRQIKEGTQAEVAELQATREALEKELHHELVTSRITAAIAEHGGSQPLLRAHLAQVVRLEKAETGRNLVIVGDDGQPLLSAHQKNGNLVNMDLNEYLTSLREKPDFAGAFPGSGASGIGHRSSSPQQLGSVGTVDGMSPRQMMTLGRRSRS